MAARAAERGALTGCSSGGGNPTITYSDSIAGGAGSAPDGGTGGDASGLAAFSGQGCTGTECADAGPGGGGGGGYFGGGGGATGYDSCFETQTSPPGSGSCNDAGPGQGGAGGSSFAANAVQFPRAPGVLGNTGDQFVKFVPVIEIDAPANGAVYAPGQTVDASWSCGFDGATGLGPGNNCAGTVASGSAIEMTPGTHTFTVSGKVNNDASQVLGATVTYYVATAPSVRIAAPSSGATYIKGEAVHSSFACTDGTGGPGIKTCVDQNGHASGGTVDTSTTGSHMLTVTATSSDGLTATRSVTYTVTAPSQPPPPVKTSGGAGGLKFTVTVPGAAVPGGGTLTVTVSKGGSGKSYKVVSYSFYFDLGRSAADGAAAKTKAVLVTRKAGSERLSVKRLSAGRHTLTVVIELQATRHKHGHKARTKLLKLKLSFTVA